MVKKPTIILIPMIRLVSLVFKRNCSAIILEVIRVGMAASNIVILATFPLIPIANAAKSTTKGAMINL